MGITGGRLVRSEDELQAVLQTEPQVVALIYAGWCPFCNHFLPVFERYGQDRDNFLRVRDDEEIVAEKYEIETIPTVLYFKDGQVAGRLDGVPGIGLREDQLKEFIGKYCGPELVNK